MKKGALKCEIRAPSSSSSFPPLFPSLQHFVFVWVRQKEEEEEEEEKKRHKR